MSTQRIDYYDSPEAPRANSLVPAVNMVVVNDPGRDPADPPHRQRQLGPPRRRDRPRRVRRPGGGPRDARGDPGSSAEYTGLMSIYSDPKHVIFHTSNGEARQEFSIVLTARPLSGRPNRVTTTADSARLSATTPDRRNVLTCRKQT